MDKASDFGSEDCAFESRRGRFLFSFFFLHFLSELDICLKKQTSRLQYVYICHLQRRFRFVGEREDKMELYDKALYKYYISRS